jgi:hypothetical protein
MMVWMAPNRHLSAKMVPLKATNKGSHPWERLQRSGLIWTQ